MACEYLILNGSDINIQDYHGQTPLFFATQLGKFSHLILCAVINFAYVFLNNKHILKYENDKLFIFKTYYECYSTFFGV